MDFMISYTNLISFKRWSQNTIVIFSLLLILILVENQLFNLNILYSYFFYRKNSYTFVARFIFIKNLYSLYLQSSLIENDLSSDFPRYYFSF